MGVDNKTAMGAKTDNIKLQLLVIDFGDSCVVKVEKGQMLHTDDDPFKDLGFFGYQSIVNETFAIFKAAIDAMETPPVPRIEDGSQKCLVIGNGSRSLTHDEYIALSTLAGHPLPIWTGNKGKWTQLLSPDSMPVINVAGQEVKISGVRHLISLTIWRYILAN